MGADSETGDWRLPPGRYCHLVDNRDYSYIWDCTLVGTMTMALLVGNAVYLENCLIGNTDILLDELIQAGKALNKEYYSEQGFPG